MSNEYAVVDLFAGPGGLAEGFSSVRIDGRRPFRIALSVEKDVSAHATLLLRSFLRQFDEPPPEYYRFLNEGGSEPEWDSLYPLQWAAAQKEALLLELGPANTAAKLGPMLDDIRERHQGKVILIGGPPCQAYSLAGRARNRGKKGYKAEDDPRHYLYREYIDILERLRPAAFIMENVKGMLSSSVGGVKVFDLVLTDLEALGDGSVEYELIALAPRSNGRLDLGDRHRPITDYIVHAEDFGLPQARHRVIVVGIRKDIADQHDLTEVRSGVLRPSDTHPTVRDVLGGMPRLRSGLSRSEDSEGAWRNAIREAIATVAESTLMVPSEQAEALRSRALAYLQKERTSCAVMLRKGERPVSIGPDCPENLRDWLLDPKLETLPNNETRSHMPSDFARYFFTALYGEVVGLSPKKRHYPRELAPDHQSWASGSFPDRFRVQLWNQPATTVTSHISKDGHYFIHPDPAQCRSLTVREAARLQTFPDNYFFKGNRTQQYVQVGNAVPPFLAKKIAEALLGVLENAIWEERW